MTSFLSEGGPLFMYTTLVVFIIIFVLFVKAVLNKKQDNSKTIKIINALGVFAIAWGFTGQIIGLISAFEVIEMAGDISPAMLAGGLKISFYAPVFGLITFMVSKIAIIILHWMQK